MTIYRLRVLRLGVLASVLWGLPGSAQDLALTKASEFGFQRLIHAAQTGDLGADVTNANVFVVKNKVRIELVRAGGMNKTLLLTRRTGSAQVVARYFNVELGDGATASDAARVAKVLDEAFTDDPYEAAWDFFGIYAHDPIPSLSEAWRYGGWTGVVRALKSHVVAPTGLRYRVAVIIGLAIALLASLLLLWWPGVQARPGQRARSNVR